MEKLLAEQVAHQKLEHLSGGMVKGDRRMGGRYTQMDVHPTNHAMIFCIAHTFLELVSRAKMVLLEHGSSALYAGLLAMPQL